MLRNIVKPHVLLGVLPRAELFDEFAMLQREIGHHNDNERLAWANANRPANGGHGHGNFNAGDRDRPPQPARFFFNNEVMVTSARPRTPRPLSPTSPPPLSHRLPHLLPSLSPSLSLGPRPHPHLALAFAFIWPPPWPSLGPRHGPLLGLHWALPFSPHFAPTWPSPWPLFGRCPGPRELRDAHAAAGAAQAAARGRDFLHPRYVHEDTHTHIRSTQ